MISAFDNRSMIVASGTFNTGFADVSPVCGLSGCYRLSVGDHTSKALTIVDPIKNLLHPSPSFWSLCGHKGTYVLAIAN